MKLSTWNCSLCFLYCTVSEWASVFSFVRFEKDACAKMLCDAGQFSCINVKLSISHAHCYFIDARISTSNNNNNSKAQEHSPFHVMKTLFLIAHVSVLFFSLFVQLKHTTMTIANVWINKKCEKLIPVSKRKKMIIHIVGVHLWNRVDEVENNTKHGFALWTVFCWIFSILKRLSLETF